MNPRTIWQNQKMESPIMTVQDIREKVGKLRTKSRREMIFNLVVSIVGTVFFTIVFVLDVHSTYEQISWGLVVAGAFYMVGYFVYESVQIIRAERIIDDAGTSSGLKFYRRTLERKRQQVRRMTVVAVLLVTGTFMTILPGMALIFQHPDGKIWIKLAPFCFILGLWGFSYYLMRRRLRHEFQREFATLESLEREYSPFPQHDK